MTCRTKVALAGCVAINVIGKKKCWREVHKWCAILLSFSPVMFDVCYNTRSARLACLLCVRPVHDGMSALEWIAQRTKSYSGSDLRELCAQAAQRPVQDAIRSVSHVSGAQQQQQMNTVAIGLHILQSLQGESNLSCLKCDGSKFLSGRVDAQNGSKTWQDACALGAMPIHLWILMLWVLASFVYLWLLLQLLLVQFW